MDTQDSAGTVIVTGGNTGLGYQCALALAAAPGDRHIVLACRNAEKAADAAAALRAAAGNYRIEPIDLDLASLASVRRFAAAFAASERPPLKAIVCNAGMQLVSGTSRTEDGIETTFGVNHLGHFLLVNLLLNRLERPARVVFVASGTHDPAQRTGMPAPRYTDARALARPEAPEGVDLGELGRLRYTNSKLCNVYCAYELDRRLTAAGLSSPELPLTVNAFDPGLMPGSGLARDYGPLIRFAWAFLMPVLRHFVPNVNSTERSGQALARLVLDPALTHVSGRYYEGLREIRSSEASYDRARAEELWDVSSELARLEPEERFWEASASKLG